MVSGFTSLLLDMEQRWRYRRVRGTCIQSHWHPRNRGSISAIMRTLPSTRPSTGTTRFRDVRVGLSVPGAETRVDDASQEFIESVAAEQEPTHHVHSRESDCCQPSEEPEFVAAWGVSHVPLDGEMKEYESRKGRCDSQDGSPPNPFRCANACQQ